MPKQRHLPQLNAKSKINHSPHVVILGAGASLAALPNGDKNGFHLPLMNNLVETLNMRDMIEAHGATYAGEDFEAAYDTWVSGGDHPGLVKEIEDRVETSFRLLQLPTEANVYDHLVLSLRKKDLIATFNWDPFLAQAFQRNMEAIGYENMPRILFLHGNVSIGICRKCTTYGWRYNTCDKCGDKFQPSTLLYPVSNKDYAADPFLESEWKTLQFYMENAYMVTVYGYSAPVTDAAARKMMLDAWTNNGANELAEIEIIDIKPKHEVAQNWADFIDGYHSCIFKNFSQSYMTSHPRRSCDAFAMATLQQDPWSENPFPDTNNLQELQTWAQHLVTEEEEGMFSGIPFDKRA